MNSFRSSMSISLIALVATLAGCGVEVGGPEAESANQAVTTPGQAAPAQDQGRARFGVHKGPGGPGSLLMAALHEDIGLSAEQRQKLEALVPKREGKGERARAERPAPDTSRGVALAAAIRSGSVDSSALAPKKEHFQPSAKHEAAHEARQAERVKALETLHATLSTEQRQKLVAAMQSHHGKARRDAAGAKDHGPSRHGAPDGALRGPLGHLLEGIELSADQKAQLEAKLEQNRPAKPTQAEMDAHRQQREAMRAEHQARLATFASDRFDAKAFLARPAKPEGMPAFAKGHAMHGKQLAAVVSVLDASQREQLAAKIEQGPPAGHGKPMMRH